MDSYKKILLSTESNVREKTKCNLVSFQVVVVSYSCNGMMLKKFNGGRTSNSLFNEDFEDYYDYEEPLPQGPTRPPPSSSSRKVTFPPDTEYYDYYEEEEPPLPSGPTRRPGQATSLGPSRVRPLSPALSQVLSLPLLTTKRPRKLKLPKKNNVQVLEEFGPFQSHFIAPPTINAGRVHSTVPIYADNTFPKPKLRVIDYALFSLGALPLAVSEDLPLFPPFNKPSKPEKTR